MRNIFFLLIVFTSAYAQSQINYNTEAKTDLAVQDSIISKKFKTFKDDKRKLDSLTSIFSKDVPNSYSLLLQSKKKLDSVIKIGQTSVDFYSLKGVHKDSIQKYISFPENYNWSDVGETNQFIIEEPDTAVKKDPVTYYLFGEEKIILEDSVINNPVASSILNNVADSDSETHFGTFWFPADQAVIPIKLKKKIKKKAIDNKKTIKLDSIVYKDNLKDTTLVTYKYLKFDRINFELYEGSVRDLRVYLKDEKNNTHVFENRTPISLLRFNRVSALNFINYTAQQTDVNLDLSKYTLRISDVLRYSYGVDGNYVPNNVSFSFPLKNKNEETDKLEKTNEKSPNYYELRQSTALNNVIDLRAYTDVLGLSNNNENGIAQIEGEADFFLFTYNMSNSSVFLFKKIKPYVSYARFDDDDRFIETSMGDMNNQEIDDNLSIIERAYFNTGLTLDLLSFKFKKEDPFEVRWYFSTRYQTAKVRLNEETEDYTTLGFGTGLGFEFRRLKNFAFDYSIEFDSYNTSQYNDVNGLGNTNSFGVLRTEAEVSYYPAKKKHNAIFLRLRAFDDINARGSSFFQAQFGYKFTIGAGKVAVK
ncbi:hypothetical protein ULMS_19300 [Patiriisocius marinistellae]|uniref:Uncharacterized protein n=1 Tax=Patiriisocius marinistellae TaxID=2494560 RepID=A0A5J4FYX4_9FLAO|nr:hypothetical protein [Patiriisocius marinistellae]GEQ86422.1 hypothetical protein ULMS_19300 [Patiriisocius marinistellae]